MAASVRVTLYITSTEPDSSLNENITAVHSACKPQDAVENGEVQPLLGRVGYISAKPAVNLEYKRMNVNSVVDDAMQGVQSHQRVLLVTCGPTSLMDAVRDSAASAERKWGHRIDVHSEDFGE